MKILTNNDDTISEAIRVLKNGGIVIYPTETVYGIGVDATNQDAVNKLLKYKSRREGKPLSIAVDSKEMASKYVDINDAADNLYDTLLPGPVTIVSKSLGRVAKGVESEHFTIGVRIPDYPLIVDILRGFGKPITATSANASYQKRPYKISDILDNISNKQKELIDLIIDVGELPKNDPSTVVDTTMNDLKVLRQGKAKLTSISEHISTSPEQTQEIGAELVGRYSQYFGYKSLVLALKGELGAGKTEMTKGIAKQLGIQEHISSPTYTLENIYKIPAVENSFLESKKISLIHMDTWRIYSSEELEALDFYNQVDDCNVFVIEWADKIIDVLEKISSETIIVWVEIDYSNKENQRLIKISDFEV
jgi:L-threonylcarbamoyladenylate synthase